MKMTLTLKNILPVIFNRLYNRLPDVSPAELIETVSLFASGSEKELENMSEDAYEAMLEYCRNNSVYTKMFERRKK